MQRSIYSSVLTAIILNIAVFLPMAASATSSQSTNHEMVPNSSAPASSTDTPACPAPPAPTPAPPAAPVPMPAPPAPAAQIIPHEAHYTVSLDEDYSEGQINEANGWMSIKVIDTFDGWAVEQHSVLLVYLPDQPVVQIKSDVITWESKDGRHFRFNVRTARNDEIEEDIRGHAERKNREDVGVIYYQLPEEMTMPLPKGTIFPMFHLQHLIESAHLQHLIESAQKITVISNLVFDGGSDTRSPVDVNAIISKPENPNLVLSGEELLKVQKVWPIHIAIYAPDTETPEPANEMIQHVLDNGVIRDMTLDYGLFRVKAILTKINIFTS